MASPAPSDLTGVREMDTDTETIDTVDSQIAFARDQVPLFGTRGTQTAMLTAEQ